MTLIKSISGIRGTIGGRQGDNLTPADIVKFVSGYSRWVRQTKPDAEKLRIVVGRDARVSGEMVSRLVTATLMATGADVVDLGLCSTPGVELAVKFRGAHGGIIITASHNPADWNALKLLNEKGEFVSSADGERILNLAEDEAFDYASVDSIGSVTQEDSFDQEHIRAVMSLPLVNARAVRERKYRVVVDAVNSVGGTVIPALLRELGCEVIELNCRPDGRFAHNPEPLPENLTEISALVKQGDADLGVVVDPDVDRLALVCEDGTMFGEEYTLVAVADYILSITPGNTVSNLSSTRALRDVTLKHGCSYAAAAVGEVNVVEKMKETAAVIGGEGNGGVIYPELHYGRDAVAGLALFLSHLASSGKTASELRDSYPKYYISKNKIELDPSVDTGQLLSKIARRNQQEQLSLVDGVKIDFENSWVHLRRSNTEPIIRIYSEAADPAQAERIAIRFIDELNDLK